MPIASEVAWAPSLIQGIAEKLRRTPAQMVVRAAGRFDAVMAAFARHFVNRSATPLLLTRGRPWQAAPRFAAVLNPGLRAGLISQIGQLSELLRRRSGAQVEYAIAITDGLPEIVGARNYDLVVLALPPSAAAQDGATARLLQTSGVDVLLVGTAPVVSADSSATAASVGSPARMPL
ncbi:MAG TPA: hypothetical protein VMF64_10730 [Steroidobacteraceae bacterium]|nr:hypothetical protein [Steroidobacteraceae bacterium]